MNSTAFSKLFSRRLLCVLSLAVVFNFSASLSANEKIFDRESIEWCDLWLTHANETNLPRVLLIGDSITRAYAPEVEKLLAGKAYVNRLASSAFISDPMLLEEIKLVLGHYHFDVIQFNNGMHGWSHSEAEYRAAFPKSIETIQKNAPGAKLVWADTTPLKNSQTAAASETSATANQNVDNDKLMLKDDLKTVSDARIAARNAIAHEFVSRQKIPVVDLHSPMLGHPEFHTDNVHFNPTGIAIQAELVAKQISNLLGLPSH